jgi:hypothetical protein
MVQTLFVFSRFHGGKVPEDCLESLWSYKPDAIKLVNILLIR